MMDHGQQGAEVRIMMDDREEKTEREEAAGREPPALPISFFAELLNLPTCKTKGYCSNCGRCER